LKIFIDDSGGFSWTPPGISLFCAVTASDKSISRIVQSYSRWSQNQPYFSEQTEIKGKDLSPMQQASFISSVILENEGLCLTLAGTRTSSFSRKLAEAVVRDSANIIGAAAKWSAENNRPSWADFYRRMAKWLSRRSPENLMWLHCLGTAIHVSLQHSIVLFAHEAHDSEFEEIELLIDKSFIGKSSHLDFWHEWLRHFLYNQSTKEPIMTIREWANRDHPFRRKYRVSEGVLHLSDLYRNHMKFVDSRDVPGVQIADICANISHRFYSGRHKYRPYRLMRGRIAGRGDSEIRIGILNESSVITDAPENHFSDYSENVIEVMKKLDRPSPA
jgi:hypothetical protein